MEPHGQSPCLHAEVPTFAETFRAGVSARRRGPLSDAHVGRHPGHTMAHSSTAKGRGLLLPG